MSTPTPRTDDIAGCLIDSEEVVPADFARALETELALLREWQREVIQNANAHHAERKDAIARADSAEREVGRLRAGIAECLDTNGHLADGDNCTLIGLKRCFNNPTAARESNGGAA